MWSPTTTLHVELTSRATGNIVWQEPAPGQSKLFKFPDSCEQMMGESSYEQEIHIPEVCRFTISDLDASVIQDESGHTERMFVNLIAALGERLNMVNRIVFVDDWYQRCLIQELAHEKNNTISKRHRQLEGLASDLHNILEADQFHSIWS